MALRDLKCGDEVTRLIGGEIAQRLKITAVDERFIHCGPWKFDRALGYEIDEDLGWGVPDVNGNVSTGSYITEEKR